LFISRRTKQRNLSTLTNNTHVHNTAICTNTTNMATEQRHMSLDKLHATKT